MTDILLGHITGQRDDYLKRNPNMVADACRAIERRYFGETPLPSVPQPPEKPKSKSKRVKK